MQALLQKYGLAALNLLQESQLLDCQQGPNESVESYSVDMLNRLDMTALPQAEKLKIYLKGLQPYYRVQVLDKGADTLETAESLAKQAESLRSFQQEDLVKTFVMFQAQHGAGNAPSHLPQVNKVEGPLSFSTQVQTLADQMQLLQGQMQKMQLQPPSATAPARNRGNRLPLQCFTCREPNYFARDCPKQSTPNRCSMLHLQPRPLMSRTVASKWCRHCRRANHNTRECTHNPQQPHPNFRLLNF